MHHTRAQGVAIPIWFQPQSFTILVINHIQLFQLLRGDNKLKHLAIIYSLDEFNLESINLQLFHFKLILEKLPLQHKLAVYDFSHRTNPPLRN